MRRLLVALMGTVLVVGLAPVAGAKPVARDQDDYRLYGRVFPDPHGGRPAETPDTSPYAKGDVPAVDFIQREDFSHGMKFLESKFPNFLEFYVLHKDFNCRGRFVERYRDACAKKFKSAGLPYTFDEHGRRNVRERRKLWMVRVTNESVPNRDKKWFVFPLSIHGIERAGVEGGTRAAEDLATWAACERDPSRGICSHEDQQPLPHPLLEATPNRSITAGEALKKSVIYFIYPNPDGWLRGDILRDLIPQPIRWYQRYNGNGVDLNRDWPEQGFTYRPYTPWSEPESRSFGKVLQAIGPKDRNGDPKWTGGIDLHGQLIDRAFSFTLIGGSERPFGKNQRVLQTVKGAWRDAEKRLDWSPLIKENDDPESDPRMYGVQWGTIWDTIDYTVTGALGNWIDSPLGLNADGIDNEMSMSHLINCGTGSCYLTDAEQLHVDGNKSLIYAMINYSLKPESKVFRTQGRVGYVFNPGVVSAKTNRFKRPPAYTELPPQRDINDVSLNPSNNYRRRFTVKSPEDGVYNGGIVAKITCSVSPIGTCAFSESRIEKFKEGRDEEDPNSGEWQVVNSYYNQSPIYLQTGQALHVNLPRPGLYRVRIVDAEPEPEFDVDIDFTPEKAWPDPGQIGYRVSNMKFWKMLRKYARPGLRKVTAGDIQNRTGWRALDTIVVTNKVYPELAGKLRRWVAETDGNLVLTDRAVRMLSDMGIVPGGIGMKEFYAGYVNFATKTDDETYDHYLARKIDQPGAAEGQECGPTDVDPCTPDDEVHRHQTYEPVPLGIAIQTPDDRDAFNSPVWFVDDAAWSAAAGEPSAVGTTGNRDQVSYGQIKYRGGRIRILGAVLPRPTEKFDHPFGLANYALTYSGYQLLQNSLTWTK